MVGMWGSVLCVFFNDTATTEIYTLSLHDALPIGTSSWTASESRSQASSASMMAVSQVPRQSTSSGSRAPVRSEEHTSELQSRQYLVCRLLLEKKKESHLHLATHH